METLRVDTALGDRQCEKLKILRSERNNTEVDKTLDIVQKAAVDRGHMFEAILDAVRAEATLGEICNRLRAEFGEYRESIVI
jgi:methylmalonyl-CoA mutase N-terminal domain/subunit